MFSSRWRKIKGLIANEELQACATQADMIWKGVIDNLPADSVERRYGLVRRVNLVSNDVTSIIRSNNIWSLAEKCAESQLLLCSLCISIRDDRSLIHPAHTDGPHTGVDGCKCLTMIIALSPFNRGCGGTYFALSNGRVVTPSLMPGDALMWHGNSVHSAGLVSSGKTRKALIARWIAPDQRDRLMKPYRPAIDRNGYLYC